METNHNNDVALVVTTAHRGVFFGYGQFKLDKDVIELKRARNCLYWPEVTRGVIGLASDGPAKGAKVGPAAPAMLINSVTAIMLCTEKAVQAWESAPWQ